MRASGHGHPNVVSGLDAASAFHDGDIVFCTRRESAEDLEMTAVLPERNPYLYWFDGVDGLIFERTRGWAERLAPVRSVRSPGDSFIQGSDR